MTNQIDSTVEEWRQVPEYEGWYSVSNLGRVRRDKAGKATKIGKILIPWKTRLGYMVIQLSCRNRRNFMVHRLVTAAFIGPLPEGYEVNHMDFNKTNNYSGNLEYVTPAQNAAHSSEIRMATRPRGQVHYKTSLTNADVLRIRQLIKNGATGKSVGKLYGLSPPTISHIRRRTTWKHI